MTACTCPERKEPIDPPGGSNRPGRLWRVTSYGFHQSSFAGGHKVLSKSSALVCLGCGRRWRSSAAYVESLAMASEDEALNIGPGIEGHDHKAWMAAQGRTIKE